MTSPPPGGGARTDGAPPRRPFPAGSRLPRRRGRVGVAALTAVLGLVLPAWAWGTADAAFRASSASPSATFGTASVANPALAAGNPRTCSVATPAWVGTTTGQKYDTDYVHKIPVDRPLNTAAGDLMVAFVNSASISTYADLATPSGWTKLAEDGQSGNKNAVFYRVVAAGEPADYLFDAYQYPATVIVSAYRGVEAITVSSAATFLGMGDGSTATVPAVNAARTPALLVMGVGTEGPQTTTTNPVGGTSVAPVNRRAATVSPGTNGGSRGYQWDQALGATGSSGSRTVGLSGFGGGKWVGWALAAYGRYDNTVTVSWTAPGSSGVPVTGYRLFRNGTEVSGSPLTATTWTDPSASPATAYTYTVRSRTATAWTSSGVQVSSPACA
ncbi:fibronectin type III domain-containing protein [Kineococcus sp. NUM-3379]